MKAIQKKTLHQEIANNLREMIMSGELREGDKIKEDELCTVMEISKTPLREALRVLSAEGLIRLIPNRGSYVTTPTFEEIKEMFDVMSVLEGVCARTAAEKMSSAILKNWRIFTTSLKRTSDLKIKSNIFTTTICIMPSYKSWPATKP